MEGRQFSQRKLSAITYSASHFLFQGGNLLSLLSLSCSATTEHFFFFLGVSVLPTLECSGAIVAHCSLQLLGSIYPSTSCSPIAGTAGACHCARLMIFLVEIGSYYVAHASLELVASSDLPASTSWVIGITGVRYHAQLCGKFSVAFCLLKMLKGWKGLSVLLLFPGTFRPFSCCLHSNKGCRLESWFGMFFKCFQFQYLYEIPMVSNTLIYFYYYFFTPGLIHLLTLNPLFRSLETYNGDHFCNFYPLCTYFPFRITTRFILLVLFVGLNILKEEVWRD